MNKKDNSQRDEKIVADYHKLYKPSIKKTDVYNELMNKYGLKRARLGIIIRDSFKESYSQEVAKRNTKIYKDFEKLTAKHPDKKKNSILTELSVKYQITVAALSYIIKNK